MHSKFGAMSALHTLVPLVLGLFAPGARHDAQAQVVGPFPIASQFSYPITVDWNCDPVNPSADTANCKQHVGDYYSIPDDSLSPTGSTHSICGKHLADDIKIEDETVAVVSAVADGVVRWSDFVRTLGYVVHIEHKLPDGSYVTSVYMHLKRKDTLTTDQLAHLPVVGSIIHRGDFVGVVTDDARDNFGHKHLHFGIRREGTSGYKGYLDSNGRAIWDPETNFQYYVGYSTFRNASLIRNCDLIGIAADRVSPSRHDLIVGNWVQAPHQFIASRLQLPPFQPGPEGFDTVYGSLYAPGPNGDLETMYDGGWGDYYYDFFKWDLSSLPSADSVSQVVLQLYFGATVNDPAFQVLRVTSPWDESTLTRLNYPTAIDWGNWTGIGSTGWHSLDITELYKNWKRGVWPNYGIELAPTYNVQTNGYIISSDYQADPTLRPKLVITKR